MPLKFEKDWADAKLWDPDGPSLRTPAGAQLYVLAVEVTDLDSKTVTDLACERFGFRESWIEGSHIFLNGVPVKLKGGWMPGAAGSDVNLNRGAPRAGLVRRMGNHVRPGPGRRDQQLQQAQRRARSLLGVRPERTASPPPGNCKIILPSLPGTSPTSG